MAENIKKSKGNSAAASETPAVDQYELELLRHRLQLRALLLDKLLIALVIAAAGYFFNRSIESYKATISQTLESYKADRQEFMAAIQAERTRELADLNNKNQRDLETIRAVLAGQSTAAARRIQAYEAVARTYGAFEQFILDIQGKVLAASRGSRGDKEMSFTDEQRSEWEKRVSQFGQAVGEQELFLDEATWRDYEDAFADISFVTFEKGYEMRTSEKARKKLTNLRSQLRKTVNAILTQDRAAITKLYSEK